VNLLVEHRLNGRNAMPTSLKPLVSPKRPPFSGRARFAVTCVLLFQAGFVCSRLTLRQFGNLLDPEGPDLQAVTLHIEPAKTSSSMLVDVRAEAVAMLRVAGLTRIPVFAGVNPSNLSRGVAWISSTTRPGEPGSVAIAGDKDTYFHLLKDVVAGDSIELSTAANVMSYMVNGIAIVPPEETRVLQDGGSRSILLVTGYPFDFIGDPPMWLIVHGMLVSPNPLGVRVLANWSKKVPL
jgi:LPXTG-site transpeptidase (sortase) family protein